MKDLSKSREEIDEIDEQLMLLFEKRMETVKNVIEYKVENHMEIYQSDREKQVIEKNLGKLKNKELSSYAQMFIEEFMSVSRAYQADLLPLNSDIVYQTQFKQHPCVGYQGVNGAFSQKALKSFFGKDTVNVGFPEFEDVYKALKDGRIDYGVLPIENTLTGSIYDNYDLIRDYNFYIVGEVAVPISQCLMALPGTKLEEITKVYSHPQGLAQSSNYINAHPNMEPMPYKDTAMAAQYVYEKQERNKAAIASPMAAKLYGLEVIEPDVQNDPTNMTRFMIISREMICTDDANKVSVIFTLNHRVGTLYNMLQIIRQSSINLVRIESRPMVNEQWQYYFYIDFEGSIRETRVQRAIEKMKANCNTLRVLGSYVKK